MFTLGLFLTTLQSFHIASASGAPLTAVGAVILFLQCGKFRKPDLVDVVLILILLIAASVKDNKFNRLGSFSGDANHRS